MANRIDTQAGSSREQHGNVWSGVVALVLLAMFAIALISSEIEATGETRSAPVATVIAGQ